MLRSMTGFGEATVESDRYVVTASLRSVNHRFLDVSIRLPEVHRNLEQALLQLVRRRLERGRVEVRLAIKPRGSSQVDVVIDENTAARYVRAAQRLAESHGVDTAVTSGDLLRLPGVVTVEALESTFSPEDGKLVTEAAELALDHLIHVRSEEGAALAAVLNRSLEGLGDVIASLVELRESLQGGLHERLKGRLAELIGGTGLDESRLAQEVAVLVERADVQEEIDRLGHHVEQFGALLDSDEAVGKRLDFLSQEILRELNTIGSKCRNTEAAQRVLDGKVLCEQLREQVQNLE